ncbi:probable Putative channel protein, exgression is glucose repressed by Mig1 and Mig2 [Phialocephala subalpina]|uniref:Probable Putative channel protein, exgression is glucose repressed by Mig1 and Mig2 n=1 Tax=Phialocephala subalpina TaxID=576137 RepID=A0A1L7WGK1_9HELO|nr:probable Putative channel protein, exgression is glucose repressed by Mig1 and Mig2 [Phialocephala subalpina]
MSSAHVENAAHMTGYDAQRLHTHDMEIGVTDAVQKHVQRNVVAPKPISQRKLDFEHARPRWMREMAAEAIGVFFYVYPGIASQASFFLNGTEPAFGSIFQIGWAYAIGIAFAIITCGSTSGGHFNPAITICFAIWQGFPWSKVPRYIFAQILGSFLAGLVLVGQYHPQLTALAAELTAKGVSPNSLGGPGSVLCSFPAPTQTNYGYLFFIEFFVDSFIGIVIWSVLDPANPFIAPTSAPFVIGLAYANMVWGFANVTISTNLARDLGTRIVAAIFFGGDAFNRYSAIALLVNVPATLFATIVYEVILRDSFAIIAKGHNVHAEGEEGLALHLTKTGTLEQGMAGNIAGGETSTESYNHKQGEVSPV